MIHIDTSQVEALADTLNAVGPKVEREADQALQRSASSLHSAAQSSAPVRTGALRASIQARSESDEWVVEATAPYAIYVEFGTYKDPPQPFLFPHVPRTEAQLEEEMGRIGDPFE